MKSSFKVWYQFLKELFTVENRKTDLSINKPIYLEQAILDLRKMFIYGLQYDYMTTKYGSKVKLYCLYTVLCMR